MKLLKRLIVLGLLVFVGVQAYKVHENVQRVMAYQPLVKKVLQEHDSTENEELVLAMIYTETKGRNSDVMQSSESSSGSRNTITDSEESIRRGVEYLTSMLESAEKKGTDTETAVQAYNFGSGYIDYVSQHGGKNTLAITKD